MIDFDALVLNVCENTFGVPITVTPIVSQRGAPPYPARGIFAMRSQPIAVEDGAILADQQTTLGIRFADFPVTPVADDRITLDAAAARKAGVPAGTYEIVAVHADGQGGADVPLRRVAP